MVRLSISFVLAAGLTLAGLLLEYDALMHNAPFEFVVSMLAMAAGLVWLWAVVKEWRTHGSRKLS
jgi:hypothetical protein